jgi:hypothetical protein
MIPQTCRGLLTFSPMKKRAKMKLFESTGREEEQEEQLDR